jgi:hypothetical protein
MTEVTRRTFLKVAASAAVAFAGDVGFDEEPARGLVVEARSAKWRTGRTVDAEVVRHMIDSALVRLTGAREPGAAWSALFAPGETIGLKFNRISRDFTGANQAIVDAIAAGLQGAGVRKADIIVVEAEGVEFAGGRPEGGWAGEYAFVSGKTRLSNFLVNQVDALINVPNLKRHSLAGFTGCLKNISHAGGTIMDRPMDFHGNACNPYIADIYALEAVRSKVRLQLMNALVGVFDGDEYPGSAEAQWVHGGLLLSADPVAVDSIGAALVDATRARRSGQPVRRDVRALRYLATAAERGLGQWRPAGIEHVVVNVDGPGRS